MRTFRDVNGAEWLATAREEPTPRHHGRWYLVFEPSGRDGPVLAESEVRWQSRVSAERTLRTMGEWELQRRLAWVQQRSTAGESVLLESAQPQPLLRGTTGDLGPQPAPGLHE